MIRKNRIAVISDIHCNNIALELVLKDIKKKNINEILFLGDYITDGEKVNEVINTVKLYSNKVIKGNREDYILNYKSENNLELTYQNIEITKKNISKENYDYISGLSSYMELNLYGYNILMVHGEKYFKSDENNHNRIDYKAGFNNIINNYEFDICFFGHTHCKKVEKYKSKIFINPGSVGQPVNKPYYTYAIIDLSKKIKVKIVKIPVKNSFDKLKREYILYNSYNTNYIWYNLCMVGIIKGKDYIKKFMYHYNEEKKDDYEYNNKVYIDIYKRLFEKKVSKILKNKHKIS